MLSASAVGIGPWLRPLPAPRTSFIFPAGNIRPHSIPILVEVAMVTYRGFMLLRQRRKEEVLDRTYATRHRHSYVLDIEQRLRSFGLGESSHSYCAYAANIFKPGENIYKLTFIFTTLVILSATQGEPFSVNCFRDQLQTNI